MSRPAARLHDQPGDDAFNGEETVTGKTRSFVHIFDQVWIAIPVFRGMDCYVLLRGIPSTSVLFHIHSLKCKSIKSK